MEKPHYFYQIKKDSEVGAALADFSERCAEAQRIALEWAKRVGAQHWYESPDGFAGGVAAVEFDDNGDRAGWDRIENRQGQVFYMPAAGCCPSFKRSISRPVHRGDSILIRCRRYSAAGSRIYRRALR